MALGFQINRMPFMGLLWQPTAAGLILASAINLNITTPTFVRATSAYDPLNNKIVAPGVQRVRGVVEGNTAYEAVLCENARTNLITAGTSEHLELAALTDIVITQNATAAPNNETTGQLITEGVVLSAAINISATIVAGSTISATWHFKYSNQPWLRVLVLNGADRLNAWFNIQTGVKGSVSLGGTASAISSDIRPSGNGWYRVTISGIVNAGSTAIILACSSAVSDTSTVRVANAAYYGWGACLEQAATPSSYVSNRNLYIKSIDMTNAAWALDQSGTGVVPVRTANYTAAPDGTVTAMRLQLDKGASAGFSRMQQTVTVLAGNVAQSFWLKTNDASTKTVNLRINATNTVVTVTGTWTRFTATANPGAGSWGFQIMLWDVAGTSQTADLAVVWPQLEYGTIATAYWAVNATAGGRDADNLSVSLTSLIDTRTNRLTYSEQMDNAAWSATDTTVTANTGATTDPNGNNFAELLTQGVAGTAAMASVAGTIVAGSTVTTSVYLKAGTATFIALQMKNGTDVIKAWFNVATGALGSTAVAGTASVAGSAITSVGNGWYRCSFTGVINAAGTTGQLFIIAVTADAVLTRQSSATYYGWGSQLEQAAFAGPYLPTAASAVSASQTGLSTTNGTIIALGIPLYRSGTAAVGTDLAHQGGASFAMDVGSNGFYRDRNITVAAENATAGILQSWALTWDASWVRCYNAGAQVGSTAAAVTTAPYTIVNSFTIGNVSTLLGAYGGYVLLLYLNRTLPASDILTLSRYARG